MPTVVSTDINATGRSYYAVAESSSYSSSVAAATSVSVPLAVGESAPHVQDIVQFKENIETAGSNILETDFQIFETLLFEITNSLSSTVQFSDTQTSETANQITDTTGDFQDLITTLWTTTLVENSSTFTEDLKGVVSLELTSVLNASDTITFDRVNELSSTLQVTDSIVQSAPVENTLTSVFQVSDEFAAIGLAENVSNTLTVTDELTLGAQSATTLTSTFEVQEVVTNQHVALENLTSIVEVSHEITTLNGSYFYTLASAVEFNDAIWVPDFNSLAWVVNTESGSLATYDNWNFQSMAYYDGVLYAVSPDGLFALDADDDAGRQIPAEWQTGFEDFGIEEKKRMSDIYVGYTGGNLECDIETYETDNSQVYTYTLEERDATAPRNNRIRVGKGLVSRRWRFTFRNVNGADFQVHDMGAEVAMSRRRL